MYNELIKLNFIKKYTTSDQTKKLLLHLFDGTQEYEERYAKDFYEMDSEQAQETFNFISGTKVNGASAILMIMRSYVRWCAANGYPASEAINDIRIDVFDKVKDSYVSSPEHLRISLDAAFPNPEKNEIEYIYRSFLWLGFFGLQVSEAIQITRDNIDLTKYQIHYSELDKNGERKDYTYGIYIQAIPDLVKAINLVEFNEPRGKQGVKKQRAIGDEILRGKVSKHSLEESIDLTFRPTISRAFKEALNRYERNEIKAVPMPSLKLTFNHIYMSGIFYRTYERERMRIPPSFDEIVLKERRHSKESKFTRNYTERKLLNILIRDMEKDYNNWKSVFT